MDVLADAGYIVCRTQEEVVVENVILVISYGIEKSLFKILQVD